MAPAIFAVALASCLSLAASARGAEPETAYRFIVIEDQQIAWQAPRTGAVLEISYALADRPVERPDARNCGSLQPMAAVGAPSGAVLTDIRRAMAAWETDTNVRFVPADSTASADLLIGIQGEPTGIAYADLEVRPDPGDATRGVVSRAAICFNPELEWEVGTIDGDPETPNLRYVTLHELGHVLGLDHVSDESMLMTFRNLEHLVAPHRAEMAGVEVLYGRPLIAVAAE